MAAPESSVLSLNFDFQKALNLIRSPKPSINLWFWFSFCRLNQRQKPREPTLLRATESNANKSDFASKVIRHRRRRRRHHVSSSLTDSFIQSSIRGLTTKNSSLSAPFIRRSLVASAHVMKRTARLTDADFEFRRSS